MTESSWLINGKTCDSVPLDDRGLAYGDGLFETMRAIGSEIPLLDFHKERLQLGCQKLGIGLEIERFEQETARALSVLEAPQSVIKAVVTRGGVASGYRVNSQEPVNLYIRSSALNKPASNEPVLNAQLCDTRLSIQPALAGIKHLNRLEQVIAAQELDDSVSNGSPEEGILLDTQGRVIEAISSNLIAVIDGVLCCLELSSSGVKGVMQSFIVEAAKSNDIPIKTSAIDFEQFCQAEEILACNSVRGVRNILAIDNRWQSKSTEFGIQLRELLKSKLNNEFYSF